MQPCAVEANTLRGIEASVSERIIVGTQVIENATLLWVMRIAAVSLPTL